MDPFVTLTAPAVPLDIANIDTDQLLPARFLKKPRSAGYGNFLFHDERKPGFPLDDPAYAGAAVLVSDRNFGCGSSREGAVYALVDGGFRCVVAPSFGDIFAANAAKNGLLTVTLPEDAVAALRRQLQEAPGAAVTVDLPTQTLTGPDGRPLPFAIDPFKKECLIEGLDDVALTLRHQDAIDLFDRRDAERRPWVVPGVVPGVV
ncbi:3-isopropylmalate dehydratase small subunit (plasmid) [Azospirillum oryzae]|uniref:3-isopropylmalate dehydratase small subunit n=1 Tax=Azospirillum oryzae TaxID=286727 RepID=A0A6N1ACR8_9PROT|nr:3-isopropylmalate dehydratase small subunit [Azospirillum oryzae]KAA0585773.1 3-isopropylmalate dehydratase small subunit [Azospirillum oryzae]QKS49485.1 3-isopropylmalate dehydratase small subunit [Azospirillum oryzae]GLR78827.1 3-isopropylmalate dehydratase small subunit [Azospirillum oryzae]